MTGLCPSAGIPGVEFRDLNSRDLDHASLDVSSTDHRTRGQNQFRKEIRIRHIMELKFMIADSDPSLCPSKAQFGSQRTAVCLTRLRRDGNKPSIEALVQQRDIMGDENGS